MVIASSNEGGAEALHCLKSTDPPLWLTPSPDLAQTARTASQFLFSSLIPFCPKSYLDTLLVQDFDAEQIWQQIDLQTEPLISNLRRDVKRFEKNPEAILKLFGGEIVKKVVDTKMEVGEKESEGLDEESEGFDEMEDDENDDFDEEDGEEEEEEEEENEEEEGGDRGIEDRFLKMSELENYMQEDEAREYGGSNQKGSAGKDSDDEEDDDEIGGFEDNNDGEDDVDKMGLARYEDFFGVKKQRVRRRGFKPQDRSKHNEEEDDGGFHNEDGVEGGEKEDDEGFDNQDGSEDDKQEDEDGFHSQTKESLSTHEKKLEKLRTKIEQMEKANLDPKKWTMQGEVTATKRPKNSALEVDLDFEHNVRPLPVITEEVTESLEELIKKRIVEGHFDDVQKAPSLPSKAPKDIKELDENKSKKGLAEIYEDEYVQQTGLGTGPVSSSDELKKEAQLLFEKLCLKLDALSHFHFKPKPIIEDMSIQTNVPALAMEEIAPVAVSDAAMLAPEEVFSGKGDIKEEAELTQEERKRRRANKKRKFKVESSKRVEKKARHNTSNGKEEP